MNHYGVTFKGDGVTIQVEAEFYEISEGFVRFYKPEIEGHQPVEFAAYSSRNVLHCVLQK